MRPWLEFCNVSAMCRSSERAAPRAVARDSPGVMEISLSGELPGRLILTDPGGIALSCATRFAAPRSAIIASSAGAFFVLLHIDFCHRYVTRFGIHVASSQCTLRAHRI